MRLGTAVLLLALAGCASDAAHTAVMYVPNRVFDVMDIARARLRVGPGAAVGLRATEAADVFLGGYGSVFVGLPGPRGDADIPWPFGLDNRAGAELSVADATIGPDYGPTEFGISLHALIVGIDVGIDPYEILDLVTGLVTIDLQGDDL